MSHDDLSPSDCQYPRVLIVYHACINKADQHGVSIRGWFAQWPKDDLGQIYSGQESGTGTFCGHSYKLGIKDRWFGWLFSKLKSSSIGEASIQVVTINGAPTAQNESNPYNFFKRIVGKILLNSGIWEFIFRPKLSAELVSWVEAFRPDIIYCQGYSLGFTWLPIQLKFRFGIPICFQTGDDWPEELYKDSVFSLLVRPVVRSSVKKLLSLSEVRFSNGPDMTADYSRKYRLHFEPLMMCDDYSRFHESKTNRVAETNVLSIIYAGTLGAGRWRVIGDLCLIANELREEGLPVQVTALVSSTPPESVEFLNSLANFNLLPAPSHEILPSFLKGADILFLPESFEANRLSHTNLSISTKAHLYMMSKKPTLIYAPPSSGIMKYAKAFNWGCRVSECDLKQLKNALKRLAQDGEYTHKLIEDGLKLALSHHQSSLVCETLRERLISASSRGNFNSN